MLKTWLAGWVCITLTTSVWAQSTVDAITVPFPGSGLGGYVNGGTAWSFVPTTNISVTEVGALPFGSPVTVRLWQNTDTLLRSFDLSGATNSGSLQFVGISPLTLFAGNTYSISLQQGDLLTSTILVSAYGNDHPDLSPFVLSSHLTSYSSYFISSNGVWTAHTPSPGSSASVLILGPTFRFTPVPEPSSFLLFGAAALLWPFAAAERVRSST